MKKLPKTLPVKEDQTVSDPKLIEQNNSSNPENLEPDLTTDLKRGIRFSNRLGNTSFANNIEKNFLWSEGGDLNIVSLVFLVTIYVLNLFFVMPIFQLNLTPAFASSQALMMVSNFLEGLNILTRYQFFLVLTVLALSTAPLSFYLFVRRNVLKHDSIAFLATLLFVLPNPFLKQGLPLIGAILNGDGAHALAFSFIPLLLIGLQSFLSSGLSTAGIATALGTAAIAIISPFATFNLMILYLILTVAGIFQGNLKVKIIRLIFVVASAFGLSLFWYLPSNLQTIMSLKHVEFAINGLLRSLPITIPLVPVVGTLLYLIFDRRVKLQPFFLGIVMLSIYLGLYWISKNLRVTGIFTAERYLIELSVATSFAVAVLFTPLSQFLIKNYLIRLKSTVIFSFLILISTALIVMLGMSSYFSVKAAQKEVSEAPILVQKALGVGGIARPQSPDRTFVTVAQSLSLATLIYFLIIIFLFPRIANIKQPEERVS